MLLYDFLVRSKHITYVEISPVLFSLPPQNKRRENPKTNFLTNKIALLYNYPV